MSSPSPSPNPLITHLHHLLQSLHTSPFPSLPNRPDCSRRASVACLIRIRPQYEDHPLPASQPIIQPSIPSNPSSDSQNPYLSQLETFFSQSWVQHGIPEILFIKRAARKGDRWTSHIALPGGKRDAQDASDVAAAVRETMEEVGINLSPALDSFSSIPHPNASEHVGNAADTSSPMNPKPGDEAASHSHNAPHDSQTTPLPPPFTSVHPDPHGLGPEPPTSSPSNSPNASSQKISLASLPLVLPPHSLPPRLITTDFGSHPLMTLSPFLFLLTSPHVATTYPLRLQPTEVSSAHWVPVSSLLDPAAQTYERADLVDRFTVRWGIDKGRGLLGSVMAGWIGGVARWGLGLAIGKVLYGGVRLRAGESLWGVENEGDVKGEWWRPERERGVMGGLRTMGAAMGDDLPWLRHLIQVSLRSSMGGNGFEDSDPSRKLVLWGLTQGIISDLLGLMPSLRGFSWWRWPTLSRVDVRLVIWVLSYRFRKRKMEGLKRMANAAAVGVDGVGGMGGKEAGEQGTAGVEGQPPVLIKEGIGSVKNMEARKKEEGRVGKRAMTVFSAAGYMLEGYFEQIQRAIVVTMILRAVVGVLAARWAWRRYLGCR